jgi:hypothetical protein
MSTACRWQESRCLSAAYVSYGRPVCVTFGGRGTVQYGNLGRHDRRRMTASATHPRGVLQKTTTKVHIAWQ